jgi:hypothetical protein
MLGASGKKKFLFAMTVIGNARAVLATRNQRILND